MDSIIVENKNISFTEFFSNVLKKYDIDKLFVSFRTDLHVTNINPKNQYETPNGVYTYPLFSFKRKIDNNITEQKFRSLFPFMSRSRYIVFFYLEKSDGLITQNTSFYNLQQYTDRIKNLYPNDNRINKLCDDFKYGRYKSNYTIPTSNAHNFWLFLYDVSALASNKNDARIKFGTICNQIGIIGFADFNGSGYIHPNEPQQAVFFKLKSIGKTIVYDGEINKIDVDSAVVRSKNPTLVINNLKKVFLQVPYKFNGNQIAKLIKIINDDNEFLNKIIEKIHVDQYTSDVCNALLGQTNDEKNTLELLLNKFKDQTYSYLYSNYTLSLHSNYKTLIDLLLDAADTEQNIKNAINFIAYKTRIINLYNAIEYILTKYKKYNNIFPISGFLSRIEKLENKIKYYELLSKEPNLLKSFDNIDSFISGMALNDSDRSEIKKIISNVLENSYYDGIANDIATIILEDGKLSFYYIIWLSEKTNTPINNMIDDHNLTGVFYKNIRNITYYVDAYGYDFIKKIPSWGIDDLINTIFVKFSPSFIPYKYVKGVLFNIFKYRINDIGNDEIDILLNQFNNSENLKNLFKKRTTNKWSKYYFSTT